MAVRSTYSASTALNSILSAINALPTSGLSTDTVIEGTKAVLDEVRLELIRTRKGHEAMLWGQEIELTEGEEE